MQSVDAAPPSIAEPARDAGTADAVAPAAEDAAAADVSAPDAAVNVDAAPPPGAMYSPCDQQTECASGLLCSSAAAWSAPGGPSYCTALCANTGTPENDCPQPGSGSVQASCYPTTGLCVLDSCEARECPSGLRCNRIETPAGGGQVFYLYVCQP